MEPADGDAEPWPAAPAPADYPATFRYEGRPLAFVLLAGLTFIGIGVLIAQFPAIIGLPVTASDQAVYWGLGLIVAAVGAFFIVGGLTSTLILYEDAIEDRSIFLTRRLMRAQIRGKASFLGGKFIEGYMIYPVTPGITPMKIELAFKRTPALDAWMQSIPEIEAPGLAKTRSSFLAFIVGAMTAGLATGFIEARLKTLGTTSIIAIRLTIFVAVWRLALILMAWAVRRWRGLGPNA